MLTWWFETPFLLIVAGAVSLGLILGAAAVTWRHARYERRQRPGYIDLTP